VKGRGVKGEVEGEEKGEREGEGRGRETERTSYSFLQREGKGMGGREKGDLGGSG
jgi:hypothetical protein